MRENKTSVARMHCDVDVLALPAWKFAQKERTEYQYITLIMRKRDILNTKTNNSKTNDPSILLVKFFRIITSREILNDYKVWVMVKSVSLPLILHVFIGWNDALHHDPDFRCSQSHLDFISWLISTEIMVENRVKTV